MVCRAGMVWKLLLFVCALALLCGAAEAKVLLKYAPAELGAAEGQFLSGNNSVAMEEADRVIDVSADRTVKAWGYCIKGYALSEMEQSGDAVAAVGTVISDYTDIDPAEADAYLQKGYILLSQGDSEGAAQAFQSAKSIAQAVVSSTQDAEMKRLCYLIIAESYFGQGDWARATEEARKAIKSYPHSTFPTDFAPFDLVTLYTDLPSTDQAAYAKLLIGAGYAVKGGLYPGAARDIYQEVQDEYPASVACAEAGYRMGEACYKLKRDSEAVSQFDAVLSQYSGDTRWCAWSRYVKGLIRRKGANFETGFNGADEEWNSVIGSYYSETAPMVRSKLALVEHVDLRNQDFVNAEDELSIIMADYPQMTEEVTYAKYLLARVYIKDGRYDEAVAMCSEILSLPAGTVPAECTAMVQYTKGLAHRAKGETDSAISSFEAALSNVTATDTVLALRMNLAEMYGIKGDKASFTEQFDAVEAMNLNSETYPHAKALAAYKKGTYLQTLGDQTGAETAFQEVMSKYPQSYLSVRAEEQIARMNQ